MEQAESIGNARQRTDVNRRLCLLAALCALLVACLAIATVAVRRSLRGQREREQLAIVERLAPFGAHAGSKDGDVVRISFSGRPLSNEAIASLKQLPQLKRLVLIDAALPADGLAHLAQLEQLEELLFISTPITDTDLSYVTSLVNLRILWLQGACITNDGMAQLTGLTKLHQLNLMGADVGDAGLTHLKNLAELSELYLNRTLVTESGVEQLRQSLPNARIRYDAAPSAGEG